MVEFPLVAGKFLVMVNGNFFGEISTIGGFFGGLCVNPKMIGEKLFLVSSEDLRLIANKVRVIRMQPWKCACRLSLPDHAAITVDDHLRCEGCKRVYNLEGRLIEGNMTDAGDYSRQMTALCTALRSVIENSPVTSNYQVAEILESLAIEYRKKG